MEWLTTFFIILAVVLLVGAFFVALGVRGPGQNVLWFFILLFLATWAIGVWTEPIGPRAWGVPWVSFFIIAVLVGLLIAAVSTGARDPAASDANRPSRRMMQETPTEADELAEEREGESEAAAVATVLNLFFWTFVVISLALLALRVFFNPAVG